MTGHKRSTSANADVTRGDRDELVTERSRCNAAGAGKKNEQASKAEKRPR
jgi:hypothetical protein